MLRGHFQCCPDRSWLAAVRLSNHMAADCQWTIEWFAGAIQPLETYPDWNTWRWSGTLTAGKGREMSVADVARQVPNAPLKDGDVVWVHVWVAGGSDKSGKENLTSFQFTYGSGSPLKGTFGISGTTTTTSNSLSVETYPWCVRNNHLDLWEVLAELGQPT